MGGPNSYGDGNAAIGASNQMPPQQPPIYPPTGYYGPPPPKRRSWLPAAIATTALLLGVAALVISLVSLSRDSTASTNRAPSTAAVSTPADTESADRALCTAIAPLTKEHLERGKAFVAMGHTGTPERDAGIADFRSDTLDWVKRAEQTLDEHWDASPYVTRTLQRFIDDRRIYAVNIRPGAEKDSDVAAWNDATVALGGPLEVCGALNIPLW
jgi:hypothetical protein